MHVIQQLPVSKARYSPSPCIMNDSSSSSFMKTIFLPNLKIIELQKYTQTITKIHPNGYIFTQMIIEIHPKDYKSTPKEFKKYTQNSLKCTLYIFQNSFSFFSSSSAASS
ncbi:uncharacterized protein DS421_4g108160 [Arachis hypogaea]|nr:uncharacterized protein DS421_4g108160 [Arachis hypogaea]